MSVIISIVNLVFAMLNLLIIFFLLIGILDKYFLENILAEKIVGVLILVLMVICYDILSNYYCTAEAAIIFCVLAVSKESREFVCLTEQKPKMPQFLLTLIILAFGIVMFIANFLKTAENVCRLVDGIIHLI